MKVINEAIVGDYHFVVSDGEYVAVTKGGDEMVHLSMADAQEVIPWLMSKILTVRPMGVISTDTPLQAVDTSRKDNIVTNDPKYKNVPSADTLAARGAKTTTPLKVGDPFLAQSAPMTSADGKQAILGVQLTDLAAEIRKAGIPMLRQP